MRTIAAFPEIIQKVNGATWEQEYGFRTITPVFGAGVEARTLDAATPVRGTSVRGHLRFWWRATRGRAFTDYRELRREEFAIWGNTENPSEVEVEVLVDSHSPAASAKTYVEQHRELTYVLFPFTAPPPTDFWGQIAFRVRVRCPKNRREDVEAALWAWANFGGVGSRTRRGCGAIFCKEFAPPTATNTLAWMQQRLFSWLHVNPATYDPGLRSWASLAWPPLVDRSRPTLAIDAWKSVVRLLADFRQLPPVGRRGNPRDPRSYSRSNWPEADSLRDITGKGIPDHMDVLTTTEAFPRAELGLPYLIKFKSRSGSVQDSANDCSVLPLDSNRVASPLILRPLALGPDGAKAIPAVLWVAPPKVKGVRIEFRGSTTVLEGEDYISAPRLSTYPNSPMARRSANGSAVEAFIAFASEKGYAY